MKHEEIIEVKEKNPGILSKRDLTLENKKGLGPPDMCMIIKEKQSKFRWAFSKKRLFYYHHYRYGVKTYSLSSIAAYFGYYLGSHSNLASKGVVKGGCFCVFDAFSRLDIRVEIENNGNPRAYLVDSDKKNHEINEAHWEGAYLSSVLRAIYPIKAVNIAYMEIFEKIQEIEQFMEIALKFWPRLGFVLDDINNTEKYGVNLIFSAISRYLIRLKRYKIHQDIFKKYIRYDPLFLTYLGASFIKMKKFEEVIRLAKRQLKITPYTFPLYYIMAKAYYKKRNIKNSLKICRYLIELNLDVYDYWHLLILCYIKSKDFNSALLCLNIIPTIYSETDRERLDERCTVPEKISVMGLGSVWNTPQNVDFIPFENQNLFKEAEGKKIIKNLSSLAGSKRKGSSIKTYKLYVKIERELEWESLINVKNSLLENSRQVYEEEKINTLNITLQTDKEKNELLLSLNASTQDNLQDFEIFAYEYFLM